MSTNTIKTVAQKFEIPFNTLKKLQKSGFTPR